MRNLLYWFAFWKEAKTIPMAIIHGSLAALAFNLFVYAPLAIIFLEMRS